MEVRKLYLVGSRRSRSVVVVIPHDVLEAVELGPGDYVSVNAQGRVITLQGIQAKTSPAMQSAG